MPRKPVRQHRPITAELHPIVYAAMIGLAAWYVLSAWFTFGIGHQMGLLMTVVGVFVVIAVAIPCAIWLSWWRFQGSQTTARRNESFAVWQSGEFETSTGRLSARHAAIEILLPLAAVSFGITAFGIILLLTATNAVEL